MTSKTSLRYLGTTVVLCALLLPLTSQADVAWSLSFGQGLDSRYCQHKPYPRASYRRQEHHHKQHRVLQPYYWHHRAITQHYHTGPYPYAFIPRHRSHY